MSSPSVRVPQSFGLLSTNARGAIPRFRKPASVFRPCAPEPKRTSESRCRFSSPGRTVDAFSGTKFSINDVRSFNNCCFISDTGSVLHDGLDPSSGLNLPVWDESQKPRLATACIVDQLDLRLAALHSFKSTRVGRYCRARIKHPAECAELWKNRPTVSPLK